MVLKRYAERACRQGKIRLSTAENYGAIKEYGPRNAAIWQ
jgi:hypothetical protein